MENFNMGQDIGNSLIKRVKLNQEIDTSKQEIFQNSID